MATILKARRLDENWDISFGGGASDFVYGLEATNQLLLQKLKFWQGEWFLDLDEGTPWLKLLGKPDEAKIERVLKKVILEVPGIERISEFKQTLDKETRICYIEFTYIASNEITEEDTAALYGTDNMASQYSWNKNGTFQFDIIGNEAVTVIWTLDVSRLDLDTNLG